MSSGAWIGKVRSLGGRRKDIRAAATALQPAPAATTAALAAAPAPDQRRSIPDRLAARWRRKDECMSPSELRRTLDTLRGVVDGRISEVEGGRRAQEFMDWYTGASPPERLDACRLMSEHFVADANRVKAAQAQYAAAVGTPDEAAAEVIYRRATVSPRRRLLQRFSAHPLGIRFMIDLRAGLQPHLRDDRRLMALDVEMEYMFSTWFDVGFLELRRISWDSPASLIERLIRYEAVHDIRSWADMKNRLDSDRRCYGFFHPALRDDPLIFVEVALVDEVASSIAPLLDETAAPVDLRSATTAIFYSISSTQQGLRGVNFGDSLIKRVVDELHQEFAQLKTFATLSPIPGLRSWLMSQADALLAAIDSRQRQALAEEIGTGVVDAKTLIACADSVQGWPAKSPLREFLTRSASTYLGCLAADRRPLDGVARFHLGNGARVERLNWAADGSPKGQRQSFGMMVNYLYDLKRLQRNRALLASGEVPMSPKVARLKLRGGWLREG